MDEKSVKRRNLIKNIVIVFLAVMLILTFASNSIMNYSLPEVSVTYASYGTITRKVRGEATVVANQSSSVTFDETRTVASVLVRVGDTVSKGDVIYELEPGESEELNGIKSELLNKKKEYAMKLSEKTPSSDTSEEYKMLEKQLDEQYAALKKAKAKLADIPAAQKAVEKAEAEIVVLKAKIELLEQEIHNLEGQQMGTSDLYHEADELKALIVPLQAKIEENRKLLSSWETKKKNAQETIESLQRECEEKIASLEASKKQTEESKELYERYAGSSSVTQGDVDAALSSLNAAKETLSERRNEYKLVCDYLSKEAALTAAESDYEALLEDENSSESARAQALSKKESAENALYQASLLLEHNGYSDSSAHRRDLIELEIADLEKEVSSLNSEYNQTLSRFSQTSGLSDRYDSTIRSYEEQIDSARGAYDVKIKPYQDSLVSYDTEIEKLNAENEALDGQIKEYENGISYKDYQKVLKTKNAELSKLQADLADAEERASASVSEEEIQKEIKAINSEINSLYQQQKALESQDGVSQELEDLNEEIYQQELKNLENEIASIEKKIQLLENKAEKGTVNASVSGVIESLSYVAGEKILAGSEAASITVADKGYTMTYNVTNEQAALISVGSDVEILYYWWGATPTARVVSIKNDPNNAGRGKIITMSLEGDVSSGQMITFSIGNKGQNFDNIVPTSAVREDANGKYVLVVDAKSTPLGNRYTARRLPVTVLSSDETKSALQGDFAGGEYIITTSSSPISSGMQVRLAD